MKKNIILFTVIYMLLSCPIVICIAPFEETPITLNNPEYVKILTEEYEITDEQDEGIHREQTEYTSELHSDNDCSIEKETSIKTEAILEQVRNDFILSTKKQVEQLHTMALTLEEHINEQHEKELITEAHTEEQHKIGLAIEKQAQKLCSIALTLEEHINEQHKNNFSTEALAEEQHEMALVIKKQTENLAAIAHTLDNHINAQDKRALTAEELTKEQEEIYINIENEVAEMSLTLDKLYEIQGQHEKTTSKHILLQEQMCDGIDEMFDAIEEQTEKLTAVARALDKQNKVAQATEKEIQNYFYELYKKQLELDKKQSYAEDAYSEILRRTNTALNFTILSVALAAKTFFVHVLDDQLSIESLLTTMLSVGILFTLYNLKEEEASSYRRRLDRRYNALLITSL